MRDECISVSTNSFSQPISGADWAGVVNNGIDLPDRATLLAENLGNIQFEAGYPSTRGHYTKVLAFHGCDNIAFRWQYNGNATGMTKWYVSSLFHLSFFQTLTFNSTTTSNTVRHEFSYKGIDLLQIKKGTLQVESVYTSADSVIYSLAVGADFTGSDMCPGTAPPPQDKTCPPIGVLGGLPPCEPHDSCPS